MSLTTALFTQPRVIVIGGGFGGIHAAKALAKTKAEVLVIDKTSQHVFQPLLYQVATATLDPDLIATPITDHLSGQKNATFMQATVASVDKIRKEVVLTNGDLLRYNYLVIAPGSHSSYHGSKNWEKHAAGLKTLDDAVNIRERILSDLKKAEQSEKGKTVRFTVVGGGPTGVELAGAISEIGKSHVINPNQVEVVLIQKEAQLLPSYPQNLGEIARHDLEKMGVKVLLKSQITDVTENEVSIGKTVKLKTDSIFWAAGNEAPRFLDSLQVPQDSQGRIVVDQDLSIFQHPEVFVIGDSAKALDPFGKALPAVAPVAMQQGDYVGSLIRGELGGMKRRPFHYNDRGSMAIIGRAKAILVSGRIQITGFLAWLIWKVVHLWYLTGIGNRFHVLRKWAIS